MHRAYSVEQTREISLLNKVPEPDSVFPGLQILVMIVLISSDEETQPVQLIVRYGFSNGKFKGNNLLLTGGRFACETEIIPVIFVPKSSPLSHIGAVYGLRI